MINKMKLKCIIKRILRQEHICRHCMKKGMVVYRVIGLGKRSYIEKHTLTNKPHMVKDIGWFIKTIRGLLHEKWVTDFSLMDAGIIPNHYNSHRSFIKKVNADRYLKYCLDHSLGGR